jgi:hypothetical protein
MNGLSYQIDVDGTVAQAEVLCRSLQALIEQKELSDQAQVSSTASLPSIDDELKALVARPSVL